MFSLKTPQQLSHQIDYVINTYGVLYTFNRYAANDFGKSTSIISNTITVNGIYHELTSFIKLETSEGAQTKSKPQPMILTTNNMAKDLLLGDLVVINNKTYKMVNVSDVNNFGVASDISLEVI